METATDQILSEIVRRLVDEFDPDEIILFGSRAWGIPRQDSDYDLCVIVPDNNEHAVQQAVRAHASLRGLGISKDVIVSTRTRFDRFSRVKASLEAKIRNRGVVLYGRREEGVGPTMASESVA